MMFLFMFLQLLLHQNGLSYLLWFPVNKRPVGLMHIAFLAICGWLVSEIFSIFGDAGIPEKYNIFVDKVDGYSYYYPSDWRVSSTSWIIGCKTESF